MNRPNSNSFFPTAFSVDSDLAASPDGSLMAVWENHGYDTARA